MAKIILTALREVRESAVNDGTAAGDRFAWGKTMPK
jgi:hypothetical protein